MLPTPDVSFAGADAGLVELQPTVRIANANENTAIFSMMNALLWRMLPIRNPQELVRVMAGNRTDQDHGAPYDLFRQGRDGNEVFTGAVNSVSDGVSLEADGKSERVMAEVVSGNYFSLLGVPALLGRNFSAEVERGGWVPALTLTVAGEYAGARCAEALTP